MKRFNQYFKAPDDNDGGDFEKVMRGGIATLEKQNAEIRDGQKKTGEKLTELDLAFRKVSDEQEVIRVSNEDLKKQFLEIQKSRLANAAARTLRTPGRVSEDCARMLGAYYLLDLVQGKKFENQASAERAGGLFKDITGIEAKAALTTADIPLPVGYSGDIVELVFQYGQARKFGTVMPLPNGSFKLPKLTTDPTFTLNALSATVTEKSPQFSFVTFTAEKFGGLIRLPSEIEEDSIVMLGQFIARYSARQMARVEDQNFFRGTGAATGVNGTAEGLTKNVVTDGYTYSQGGTTTGGKTAQSQATLADFRALRAVPTGAVLGDAAYYVHPTYESLFAGFNTSATVTPYVRNSGTGGATLDGFPIRWIPVMPALSSTPSASLCHALFGDVSYEYLGVRGTLRFDTSREAGFTTDEILIRALERFTVGKMAVDCAAGLLNDAT